MWGTTVASLLSGTSGGSGVLSKALVTRGTTAMGRWGVRIKAGQIRGWTQVYWLNSVAGESSHVLTPGSPGQPRTDQPRHYRVIRGPRALPNLELGNCKN